MDGRRASAGRTGVVEFEIFLQVGVAEVALRRSAHDVATTGGGLPLLRRRRRRRSLCCRPLWVLRADRDRLRWPGWRLTQRLCCNVIGWMLHSSSAAQRLQPEATSWRHAWKIAGGMIHRKLVKSRPPW
jgi:hypothetical protein